MEMTRVRVYREGPVRGALRRRGDRFLTLFRQVFGAQDVAQAAVRDPDLQLLELFFYL